MNYLRLFGLLTAAALLALGCKEKPVDSPAEPGAKESDAQSKRHDHEHGRTEKSGHDYDRHRPFSDPEAYIAHLERDDRAAWQKPDELIAYLALTGSETLHDVGAGSGYFAVRFARALPNGKVIAGDPDSYMVKHLAQRIEELGLKNVEVVEIPGDRPALNSDMDVVFMCNVLHHVKEPGAWLKAAATQLPDSARLVLVEFKKEELPFGPPPSVKFSEAQVKEMVAAAGLEVVTTEAALLPYQNIYTVQRARRTAP